MDSKARLCQKTGFGCRTSSLVELAQKRGERGKNSNKDKFGIIRKQIFH